MCCDANEQVNIEVAMHEKGVGWILCKLAGSKETKTESDMMDIDNTAKIEVPQDHNTGFWLDCPTQAYPG